MLSFSFNNKYINGLGKISISNAVQAQGKDTTGEGSLSKGGRTSTCITNLPSDCLNLLFKSIKARDDRNSFGLTCHRLLHIQNDYHESLWYLYGYGSHMYPKMSPEIFPMMLCKLLTRFQHLKYLSLNGRPKIIDLVKFRSQFFASEVQSLRLDDCFGYSDVELSSYFSWFPHLTYIRLKFSLITDKGLVALTKYCLSLETVELSWCHLITDLGLSLLSQNCRKLRSLEVDSCNKITSNVTGNGFIGVRS